MNYNSNSDIQNNDSNSDIQNYEPNSDIQNYEPNSDIQDYKPNSDIQDYNSNSDTQNYEQDSDLHNYQYDTNIKSFASEYDFHDNYSILDPSSNIQDFSGFSFKSGFPVDIRNSGFNSRFNSDIQDAVFFFNPDPSLEKDEINLENSPNFLEYDFNPIPYTYKDKSNFKPEENLNFYPFNKSTSLSRQVLKYNIFFKLSIK